jgi:hypothetical protein
LTRPSVEGGGSLTPDEDAALMTGLHKVHDQLKSEGRLGPAARDLRRANPTAVYEIRPIPLYLPGVPFPVTAA